MPEVTVAGTAWFQKPETQAIFACLDREGFEARAVGGAVRDSLLGRTVTEVDFATTATPPDIVRLATRAGFKPVPTGADHGTVTVVANGVPFEVTTLRRDIATDGRRAVVAFGKDWAQDARRRDFTMNALFADATGRVHDPLGGLPDLMAGRVRFIGEASARIREDFLRILRFFRFSANYAAAGFDAEGVAASIRERHGLLQLSRERVRSELLRILVARRAADAIRLLDETGLLSLIAGGVARRMRFERLAAVEASLGLEPDPIFRLAALALFIEEDAKRLADRLRLASAEASDLAAMAALAPKLHPGSGPRKLEAALYRLGLRLFRGRLLLAWAESSAPPGDESWRQAVLLAEGWRRPVFPLAGRDLLALGFEPGPKVGTALQTLEDRWIESGFTLGRDELLGFLANY